MVEKIFLQKKTELQYRMIIKIIKISNESFKKQYEA